MPQFDFHAAINLKKSDFIQNMLPATQLANEGVYNNTNSLETVNFQGFGLTYHDSLPVEIPETGTFTSMELIIDSVSIFTVTENMLVDAGKFGGYLLNSNWKGALNFLFKDSDVLNGFSGKDTLNGFNGNDRIVGNAGADKLFGDNGNDTLVGGAASDQLTGGAGADTFLFQSASDFSGGGDLLLDLTDDDWIDLRAMNISGLTRSYDGSVTTFAFDITGDFVMDVAIR
ncbi:MAG: calcium-binding protein, partial [Caulobacteraceae bacterium]